MPRPFAAARAFTLIELLAVVAIITLLMGILVPAISRARDQARKTKTAGQIKAMGTGAEMFHNEMSRYPRSHGENPFVPGSYISGAQWLAIQIVGADLRGYVKPISTNDTSQPPDGIDEQDWNDWYDLSADYPRIGPYVKPDGAIVMNAVQYASRNPSADQPAPDQLEDTANDWDGGKIPFFVDSFGFPILYYKANAQARLPFTTNSGGAGRYDQSDNGVFTGAPGGDEGRDPNNYVGWDLTGNAWDQSGAGVRHPMGVIGWDAKNQNDPPLQDPSDTFASVIYDSNIFETTRRDSEGRVWPYNDDSFILISPGKDGLYGTSDDIRNFQSNY